MNYIAQNFLTMSKGQSQWPQGTPDRTWGNSLGPQLYIDKDGHIQLTDYTCALGANLIDIENSCSIPTQQEQNLGFRLSELFPCIEKVKILKTGTDACNAAVRIARAYTGKIKGCGKGYHGWGDTFISAEEPGLGTTPGHYIKMPTFDKLIDVLKEVDNLAFCIIEPVELNLNVQRELKEIRRLCSEKKIILIFDEIITGFRFPEYGVCNYYDVQPDLICLGKGLGNGYPISIVGGSGDIMDKPDYFVSGTFYGELSGINAALDTLDYLTNDKIKDLWRRGMEVIEHFNMISDIIQLKGYPTRCVWDGDENFIAVFCQQMLKKGYLLHPRVWFIMHAHTSTINAKFIDDSKQCINEIVSKNITLKGPLPEGVFKR